MKTTGRSVRGLILVCSIVAAALLGCGGGGGNGGYEAALKGSPVNASGVVSGFGSVIVGGTAFDVTQAQVAMDGSPAKAEDLRVGMVVTVLGSVQGGGTPAAASVEYEDDVEGPITDLSGLGSGRMEVLDQVVVLDDLTVVQGVQLSSLNPGDIAEVSGYVGADGQIRARYVERKRTRTEFEGLPPASREIEVRGVVEGHLTEARTFQIGGLAVQYADQALDAPIRNRGGLQNGLLVRVRSGDVPVDGPMVARRVELAERARLGEEEGLAVRLEGILTWLRAQGDFEVNGHRVRTTTQTRFERGTEAELVVDARLTVEGELDADGAVLAKTVRWAVARNIKIEAEVSQVNAAGAELRVLGIDPGIDVSVAPETLVLDRRVASATLTLEELWATLEIGARVGVRAYAEDIDGDGSDEVVAARLELKNAEDWVRLQAPPGSVDEAGRSLTILGVAVATTQATEYVAPDESLVDPEEFFSMVSEALAAGDRVIVKASGAFVVEGGVEKIVATVLELEACRDYDHEYEHDFDYGGSGSNLYEFDYEHEYETSGPHGQPRGAP